MKNLAVLCLLLSSCGFSAINPPDGFVRIDRRGYDMAATAADGSKVFVSIRPGEDGADADFWLEVIERDLQARGYEALKKDDRRKIKGGRLEGRERRSGRRALAHRAP